MKSALPSLGGERLANALRIRWRCHPHPGLLGQPGLSGCRRDFRWTDINGQQDPGRLLVRTFLLALAVAACIPLAAYAGDSEEFTKDLGRVVGAFTAAELYVDKCNSHDPDGASSRRDILAGWAHANGRPSYDRLMEGLTARAPELATQLEPQRRKLAAAIEEEIQKTPDDCSDLARIFNQDSQFSVERLVRKLMRSAASMGIDIPAEPVIVQQVKKNEDIEILRLAALSARLEAKMAETGSKEGARGNRDLSTAREDHAERWLKAEGVQVLFGRVVTEDEVREWRGDRQSSFSVHCKSFADKTHEVNAAQAVGQERVVTGMVGSVVDTSSGGKLTLNKCRIFTVEETGRPFVEEDDEAGLMLRPLEESEAYAGPLNGIQMSNVDRVLYEASFDNRMDGFGNGYVDRDEAIYILLKDGTAYQHEWSFPFTDLAVERSKEREPQRWFQWTERDEKVVLTHLAGDDIGQEIELQQPQRLEPMSPTNLQARYYYLQVGVGGSRQDRSYVFDNNGTVKYQRSGFVAGNVGTSYIIVNGKKEGAKIASYRFEDFALVLNRDGQTERYFLAVPASAQGPLPDTVIIRGEAYWLDKKRPPQ